MEYHKELVRSVARAFYETEHIVIIDTLVAHHAVPAGDIATVLDSKQIKNVQRFCAKLKEAGLISTYARQEMKEGALKPMTREYYYIDYRHAIDATKYRIHMIDERIKRDAKPTTEKKEYICKTCGADWVAIDVLDHRDPELRDSGFLCKRCDNPLTFCNTDETIQEQDDRPSLFNRQFSRLLGLLQKIDESSIPEITGEQALSDSIPIPKDDQLHLGLRAAAVSEAYVKPSAVRGMVNANSKIEIEITTDKESSVAEVRAAAESRAKAAQQNALPSWYTHSTITGDSTGLGANVATDAGGADSQSSAGNQSTEDISRDPNLDAYFIALKADQERKAREESADEDDDDDDDEFEDVSTQAFDTQQGMFPGEPSAKRVKTEASQPMPPPPPPPPVVNMIVDDGEDDDDDDDDFEDVV